MTLKDIHIGESVIIDSVGGEGALRQHFLDMGVIPGTTATVIKYAPMGDPMELRVHGYELTLRLADAGKILVHRADASSREIGSLKTGAAEADVSGMDRKNIPHPYLGEPGIHHDKAHEEPLPEGHTLTFALVGNQNCGKTTLFNCLTGANQHVGNFPGVTVDSKSGPLLGYPNTSLTDLPGIYSMSPYSAEEVISRQFVLEEKPDAIINIVDATNIERNLYLTMQLLEMDRPMVLALNMMDEMTGNGGSIDVNRMEAFLGIPVVPISAAKGQGIQELLRHALHVARYQEKPLKQDFCSKEDYGGAVHRCLHSIVHLIEDHAARAGLPPHFAASKVAEGDQRIMESLKLDRNEQEMLDHITLQMELERGLDRSAAMADMRFSYIEKVAAACVIRPGESKEHARSVRLDKLLTGKYTAIPLFILIMGLTFYLTFDVIGAFLQDFMQIGIDVLTDLTAEAMSRMEINATLCDLILNGIFRGVGSVLSFMPIVVVMFFFLSLLEDSGYIARVAFVMDRLMRKIGLSGRSIVPLLLGFGCTVPAVMATRILPSERDRRLTILLTPFMSCSAKLPVYGFLINAFFSEYRGLIMVGLYVLGILLGILNAFIYQKIHLKGEAVPFVMELPNYRLPGMKTTRHLMWEKAKDFLQKAFSVILIATIIIWFLQRFDFHLNPVTDSSESIMAALSGLLVPLMKPLGLGDWRICTSLISGVMAKESVVSTMEVLFSAQGGVAASLTPAAAGSLLVFSLLYTPCVAAIGAIRRELGAGWAAFTILWQCFIAWITAFLVHLIMVL
ncbi:MAG: ferrous iron transport protein B [Lachnospiraceae bacterium]|nr:ferrous iron transport protein B [Lachnospiraceae bacterium]